MSAPRPAPLSRSARRAAVGTGAGLLAAVLLALPASAHVTVSSQSAEQGGYSKLTFRVPTERDDVSTTKVVVQLPQDTPFGYVAVKPHEGWTVKVADAALPTPITTDDGTVTKAASTITWTADSKATGIQPGQFDEFDVAVGPLPATSSLSFKTLQTYSDGETVRWIEEPAAGAAEPEHPAPALTLTPAGAGEDAAAGAGAGAAPRSAASSSAERTSGWPMTVAVLGLAVGAVGLGTAVLALRATRRKQAPVPVATPGDREPVH